VTAYGLGSAPDAGLRLALGTGLVLLALALLVAIRALRHQSAG
jgi:hypothetical protein